MTEQGNAQNSQAQNAQLRNDIRQSINAAREAAQDAANDAVQSGNRTIIVRNGVPVPPVPPVPPTPGFTIEDGYNPHDIPPGVKDVAMGFFVMCAVMVIGWPLARAFGRRIEHRASTPAALPSHVSDQLQRIEQAVDAMSIEVERISESQRFIAKLQGQGERMPLPPDRG